MVTNRNLFWLLIFFFSAQRLFNVPAWLYSLLVCGKVAFQHTLDVYADRYVTATRANIVAMVKLTYSPT